MTKIVLEIPDDFPYDRVLSSAVESTIRKYPILQRQMKAYVDGKYLDTNYLSFG